MSCKYEKIGLYSHNMRSYDLVKNSFDIGENIVGIVHATGTGKSYIALQLAYDNKDKKVIYVVPLNGIIEHIDKIIEDNHNLDFKRDFPNLEIRTYQSFISLSEDKIADIDCDLLILDEFHHLGAPVWGAKINTMIKTHSNMKIFGMTAYTVRDRGTIYERDMANPETCELFSNKIVSTYDLCDAMIDQVLPQPIYKAAYINLMELEQQLEKKINTVILTSEEYKKYMELLSAAKKRISEAPSIPELIRKNIKSNGKYIYFCPPGSIDGINDIKTLEKEALEWFKSYIPEEDIVFYETTSEMGNYGKQNRIAFYNDTTLDGKSAKGKLRVMFAINQYNEGVHVSNIDGVIMGRGTTSDIVYFEQLGRALSVRGNTKQECEKYNKYDISKLIELCNNRQIFIDKNTTKEQMIQKITAPLILDLTNNFDFISQLENNLKDRIKEIQKKSNKKELSGKMLKVLFDIDILNKDLFEMLIDLRYRLFPQSWDEMYGLAEKYYQHYKTLIMPYKFKTLNGIDYDENGKSLDRWIGRQTELYNNNMLSEERINKLIKLGMDFLSRYDRSWNTYYELAEKYYQHYGNLEIPYRFKTFNGVDYDENGVDLGNWISVLRYRYKIKKVSEERINQLKKICMRFEAKAISKSWDEWYELAKNYYQHYGNLEVQQKFKTFNGVDYDANGYGLGYWIRFQRKKYKNNQLSDEQIQKLESIGMIFYRNEHKLTSNEIYVLAKRYYEYYGNLEIPVSFKTINGVDYDENGYKLGGWVQNQREKYKCGKMSKMHFEKLKKIGMRFEATFNNDKWHKYYELAKKYYEHYGNLKIPIKFKTLNGIDYNPDGFDLYEWVAHQREKYKGKGKILDEQVKLLDDIEIQWFTKSLNFKLQHEIISFDNLIVKKNEIQNRFYSMLNNHDINYLPSSEELTHEFIDELNVHKKVKKLSRN